MIEAREYDPCVKCTTCNGHCPVYRVNPAFPGPKFAGPEAARLGLLGHELARFRIDLCTNCKTCEVVCPSGVRPASMIVRARGEQAARQGLGARDWLLSRGGLLGRIASPLAPLVNPVLGSAGGRVVGDLALRIHRRRGFPRYVRTTFRKWFSRRRSPWSGRRAPAGRVAYFHGCYVQYNDPAQGRQAVEVLERNGFEVVLPEQQCCGLPLIANGDLETARRWARLNVERVRPHVENGTPLLFTSASCGLTFKNDYRDLLDVPGAAAVADSCFDISEFLLMLHREGRLATSFRRLDETIPYHLPCHLRAQGVGAPALPLLRLIPGLDTWDLDSGCCGIAGTYGFKREKYNLSMAIGRPLFEAVRASGASRVVTDCETCAWQIQHGAGVPGVHPVSILWEAYGGAG